ncbi:MAG: transporter [Gallionella sp.]|nr:transporter [Gallionella sp.]
MVAKIATKIIAVFGFVLAATNAAADHPTVAFGSEAAGAINTIPAEPMPQGKWGFGIRTEIIDNKSFSGEQLEGFAAQGLKGVHSVDKITSTSIAIAYGVGDDLTVIARLPYIERINIREGELEDGVPEAHVHGGSSGVGDLLLLGQYRAFRNGSTDASILFGLKAPTGETDVKDRGGVRFDTEFQPGTGSWDIMVGAAISKKTGKAGFHANILYNNTTEGSRSTELGDALSYNVALSYRLNGEDHTHHDHAHHHGDESSNLNWDLLLELNGETRRKDKKFGVFEANSGGDITPS